MTFEDRLVERQKELNAMSVQELIQIINKIPPDFLQSLTKSPDQYLTTKEASQYFKMSSATLTKIKPYILYSQEYTLNGRGKIRWNKASIEKYLAQPKYTEADPALQWLGNLQLDIKEAKYGN